MSGTRKRTGERCVSVCVCASGKVARLFFWVLLAICREGRVWGLVADESLWCLLGDGVVLYVCLCRVGVLSSKL